MERKYNAIQLRLFEMNLSAGDFARLMGISRQRAHQLINLQSGGLHPDTMDKICEVLGAKRHDLFESFEARRTAWRPKIVSEQEVAVRMGKFAQKLTEH